MNPQLTLTTKAQLTISTTIHICTAHHVYHTHEVSQKEDDGGVIRKKGEKKRSSHTGSPIQLLHLPA